MSASERLHELIRYCAANGVITQAERAHVAAELQEFEMYAPTIAALRSRIAVLELRTQYVLDLLRTGLAPAEFGLDENGWNEYKIRTACRELAALKGDANG